MVLWNHLVRSFVLLLDHATAALHARCAIEFSKGQTIVLGTPWMLRRQHPRLSRARRVKTVNLDAAFERAAYKRLPATLTEIYQLG